MLKYVEFRLPVVDVNSAPPFPPAVDSFIVTFFMSTVLVSVQEIAPPLPDARDDVMSTDAKYVFELLASAIDPPFTADDPVDCDELR